MFRLKKMFYLIFLIFSLLIVPSFGEKKEVQVSLSNDHETTYIINTGPDLCVTNIEVYPSDVFYEVEYKPLKVIVTFPPTLEKEAKVVYTTKKCKIYNDEKLKCLYNFEDMKISCISLIPKDTKTIIINKPFTQAIINGKVFKVKNKKLILPDDEVPKSDTLITFYYNLNQTKKIKIYFNNQLKMVVLKDFYIDGDSTALKELLPENVTIKKKGNDLVIDLQGNPPQDLKNERITFKMYLNISFLFLLLIVIMIISFIVSRG